MQVIDPVVTQQPRLERQGWQCDGRLAGPRTSAGRVRRVQLVPHLEQRAAQLGRSTGALDHQGECYGVTWKWFPNSSLTFGGVVRLATLECCGGVDRTGGLIGDHT